MTTPKPRSTGRTFSGLKIHQLVPAAPGWWVRYLDDREPADEWVAPVAVWALTEDSDGHQQIYGVNTTGVDFRKHGDVIAGEVVYFYSPEPPAGAHGVGDPGLEANRRTAEPVSEEAADDTEDEDETTDCERCGDTMPADTRSVLHCADGWEPSEGPICAKCLDQPDADTCLKCNGIWWTGVNPPYTEENSPGTVCPSCLEAAFLKD